jgi:ammonium transporter Rh
MMFIGFGFLMTFLRRYSFGSIAYNFVLAAYAFEWATIMYGFLFEGNGTGGKFELSAVE